MAIISDIVGSTVNDFVDIALFAVTIMIIWYVIKFFMVAPPTEEEKEEKKEEMKQKGEETKAWINKKMAASRRKELLEPAKGFVIRAEQALERLRDDELKKKSADDIKSAEKVIGGIKSNLENAKKLLKKERKSEIRAMKANDGSDIDIGSARNFLTMLYDSCAAIIINVEDKLEGKVPPISLNDAQWKNEVKLLKDEARQMRAEFGVLISKIDAFVDRGQI